MTFWRTIELLIGFGCILMGLLAKEFTPIGWTTKLIWGGEKCARIPRWIAGSFYVVLGFFSVYLGLTGK